MRKVAALTGQPVSVNLNQSDKASEVWRDVLRLLDEAHDDGLPIVADIGLPATLRDSTLKQAISMVYLSMHGEGSAVFTVQGAQQDWDYTFALRASDQTRCPVGRGIRENYLGFGLSNPGGQAFTLDRVEVLTAQSKTRRV